MDRFTENDLVIGELYFCVYNNIVYHAYADTSEVTSGKVFRNDKHEMIFYAYECSLIYRLEGF